MKSIDQKSSAVRDPLKDCANKRDAGGLTVLAARIAETCEKVLDSIEYGGFLLGQILVRRLGGTKTVHLIHKNAYQVLPVLLAFGVILAYVMALRLSRMSYQ